MDRYRRPLVLLALLLCGCGPQIRMTKEPIAGQIADYGWSASAPDGVSATLRTVLVRNSPGSWMHNADWDEYVLTVKNSSSSAVEVEKLTLFSPYLSAAQQSSLSLQQLEITSRETQQNVRDVAIVAGTGAVAVGTTAAVASSAAIVAATAPLVALAGAGLVDAQLEQGEIRRNREQQDKSLIQLTILERGIHLPMEVPAGAEALRSAFFPLTPAPNRLILGYRINDEHRELEIALPALAQLHIRPGTTPR